MKILIEMKHGLGDCVTMLPAVKAVRDTYPDAYIALLVNGEANKAIFEHSGIYINRYYYFSLKNRSKLYTLKILYQLHREHFTHGVMAIMTPEKKGKILFSLLGIKQRFGEQYEGLDSSDLDDKVHFVERNLNVVRNFTHIVQDKRPELYISDSDYIDMARHYKNSPGIAVNIGGADKNYFKGDYVYTRAWDPLYMKELVGLLSMLSTDIYLLGGKLEEPLLAGYDEILSKNNVHNFVNRTSIGQTMYILYNSMLSIGVDTGMQHVADALGIRTLSIFGPTNPKTHGAYSDKASFIMGSCPEQSCYNTDLYYTCEDRICLNQITPQSVFTKAKSLI